MGIGELAAAAGMYLVAKASGKLAETLGGEVGGRIVKLLDTVRAKLQERGATKALANLEAKPEDARRRAALEVEVEEALEGDATFRDELAKLVDAIPEETRAAIQQIANVTGNQNVTTQIAGAGNQVNVGPR